MKKRIRVVLITVLAGVFVLSAGMMIHELVQYQEGEKTYQEAEKLVDLPDFSKITPAEPDVSSESSSPSAPYVDPYAEELRNMDFSALQAVNNEILGWILIPNTVVSYPLVQADNDTYYLKHTWKKETSVVGSIFLECENSGDFSNFNTILYGHNMNNGSMFGSLKKYKSKSYWQAHPYVYITNQNGSRAYRIFAAYEASTSGVSYQIGFSSDTSKQSFLDACIAQSVIATGVTPTIHDQILTLSTCTGYGHATRWVVQAVLKSKAAADSAQSSEQKEEQKQPAEEQTEPGAPGSTFASASSSEANSTEETLSGTGTEEETKAANTQETANTQGATGTQDTTGIQGPES